MHALPRRRRRRRSASVSQDVWDCGAFHQRRPHVAAPSLAPHADRRCYAVAVPVICNELTVIGIQGLQLSHGNGQ